MQRTSGVGICATIAIVALTACGSEEPGNGVMIPKNEDTRVPTTLRVDADTVQFSAISATRLLGATVLDDEGDPVDTFTVQWESSDEGVATVNAKGLVTARANGSAVVRARYLTLESDVVVNVMQVPTTLELLARRRYLDPGDTLTVSGILLDSLRNPITQADIEWSSGDSTVLEIDDGGRLTALVFGRATVRARVGELQASEQFWVVEDVAGPIVFRGGTVLPMAGGSPMPGTDILVENGQVTQIGPALAVPSGTHEVDATGKFIMPGLSDMHTHPFLASELTVYALKGVTTIMSVGHTPSVPIYTWRQQQRAGELIAPTIYTTGQIVDGAGVRLIATIVTDSASGAAVVQAQHAEGVDAIKVYNSLTPGTLASVVHEADILGLPVVGHGVRSVGLAGMLDIGVDAVAHGEEIFYTHFSSTINPSLIDSAVTVLLNYDTWVMPNLSTFARITALWGNSAAFQAALGEPAFRLLSPEREGAWQGFFSSTYANRTGSLANINDFLVTLTSAMQAGGVKMVLSTDSPIIPSMYPGFSAHEDMERLTEAGLSDSEVLEIATANGGDFVRELGMDTEVFGVIQVGARADLLMLRSDPTIDVRGIQSGIQGVMIRGRYLGQTRLEQLEEDLAREYGRQ